MASATVRIKIVGSEAIKELQGVRREVGAVAKSEQKAAAATEKAAKHAADVQKKAALDAERVATAAAKRAAAEQTAASRKVAREAERAAADQKREADRLTAYYQKLAHKSADHRIREERRVSKEAAREAAKQARIAEDTTEKRRADASRALRRAGGFLGGAAAGVLAGGVAAAGVARGVAGVDDASTRVQKANDFRERLIVTAGQAGLDDAGTTRVQTQVQEASMASGKEASELVGVLEAGQAQFNDLKFYADNLKELSIMSKATGSDTESFARAVGFLRQAFNLSGTEAMESAKLMIAAASKGSIEAKDFANDFAPVAGVFAQGTRMTGMKGVREFLGVAQAGGTLGAGSAETATMTERFVALLQNPDKMDELRTKAGIDVRGKTPTQVIEELATSKRFNAPGKQADIFGGDIIANKMITALMSARNRVASGKAGAVDIATIAGVKASEGSDQVAAIMARLESSGLLDLQRQAIEMQNHTITHLKTYNEQIIAVTKATNSLEKSFGTLGLWASSIGVGGAVTGGTMLLGKLGGGAAGAGAGAAVGGGALATLGTGVAAAGAGAIAGTAAAGLAIGGGIGMGIDKLIELAPGKKSLSTRIAELFSSEVDEARARLNQGAPANGEVQVKISLEDNRVGVKTKSKGRGINTSAGPAMAGAGS